MANELVNIADQYKGLPMADLIGSPLTAACDAQIRLARATSDFIQAVGFNTNTNTTPPTSTTRTAEFTFKRPVAIENQPEGKFYEEEVSLSVPLLAILKIPNLSITKVDIVFDMEVKSSFMDKSSRDISFGGSAGLSIPFKGRVQISGSVASHKENTRSSDNSAKYHVEVHAVDDGMPEGLARVMDILQSAVAPRKVGDAVEVIT